MLPGVSIDLLNGQLGRIAPTDDGVAGMVLFGPAAPGLALSTPKQIFTLKEAEDLGINAAYDTANTVQVHRQIREFYERAGNGAELWIMLVAQATTMEDACDTANDIAKKLLNAASGRIRLFGIDRVPDGAYTPTFADGIDDDVNAAVLKLHALAEEFATAFKPFRGLVGARGFQGTPANLRNFRANTNNRCGVVLGSTANDGIPAVGFTLGQFVNRTVQRKISRVKDGDVGLVNAYFTDGSKVEDHESAWGSIHDKGYIFFRRFAGKNGYFFNSDPSCSPLTDDYALLSRGRVIDKALTIAYTTFVDEIEDDLEVDESGFIAPAVVQSYQSKIEQAISLKMVPDEASGVRCTIDPVQNLLATDKVVIGKLAIRPKGYSSFIEVSLGFDNPLNEA